MKTSAELIADLGRTIGLMEEESLAALEYAGLLCELTASPDAECALDGIHRLLLEIRDHANSLKLKQGEALDIIKRLANQ